MGGEKNRADDQDSHEVANHHSQESGSGQKGVAKYHSSQDSKSGANGDAKYQRRRSQQSDAKYHRSRESESGKNADSKYYRRQDSDTKSDRSEESGENGDGKYHRRQESDTKYHSSDETDDAKYHRRQQNSDAMYHTSQDRMKGQNGGATRSEDNSGHNGDASTQDISGNGEKKKTILDVEKNQGRHKKQIPNSTRIDEHKQKFEDLKHKKQRRNRYRHKHGHRKNENHRFTTEASIRRIAEHVINEKEAHWRNETVILRHNITYQAEVLARLQISLQRQEDSLSDVQQNDITVAKQKKIQADLLNSLREELDEIHRFQQIQEASFREIEMAQQQQELANEEDRLAHYVDGEETEKISDFLKGLNLTNSNNVQLLSSNIFNGSNILVFPRTAAVSDKPNSVQGRHEKFLSSQEWLDEICYNKNGTKSKCTLSYTYSDPCVHFFCTSLCLWTEEDCPDFDPGPPSFQCPYAKCEPIETLHSLLWLWIILPFIGLVGLGMVLFK